MASRGVPHRPKPRSPPPPGEWKLPEVTGENPLYALVELGTGKFLAVFDQRAAKDEFYNRLRFDVNGDGQLADDETFSPQQENLDQDFAYVTFPPIDVETNAGGPSVPYCFRVNVYAHMREEIKRIGIPEAMKRGYMRARLELNCGYSGEFEVGGKKYHAVLADANANARFADTVHVERHEGMPDNQALYPQGDQLYLSTNREFNYRDGMAMGHMLHLAGTLYDVAIDLPAKRMTLTPVTTPLKTLDLAAAPTRMVVYTKDEARAVMLYEPGDSAGVPEGAYHLAQYQLQRKDDQGDLWRLDAVGTPKTPEVDVGSRGGTLKFGEPYVPIAEVPQGMGAGMGEVQLAFRVEGAAYEAITDLAHVEGGKTKIPLSPRNQQRPKEPAYKIVTGDGEVVTQGVFEYG